MSSLPYPAIAALNAKENFSDDGWNAYPKFVPKNGTYEVVLCDGRQRVCSWKSNVWSFYGDEIVAFKEKLFNDSTEKYKESK